MDTGWFRHSNTRAGTLRAAAELIDAGAESTTSIANPLKKHVRPPQADGRDPRGMQTDLDGRVAYATISLARSVAHRCDPAGFRRPGGFHGQHAGRRGRHALHRASPRRREGLVPRSQRPGLFAAGRPVRRRRPSRSGAGATLPGSMAEIVERVLAAVRQALGSDGSAGMTTRFHQSRPAPYSARPGSRLPTPGISSESDYIGTGRKRAASRFL